MGRREVVSMDDSQMLSPIELAHQLGVSRETLRRWRVRGQGPDYHYIGRQVRYEPAAVRRWLERQRVFESRSFGEPE